MTRGAVAYALALLLAACGGGDSAPTLPVTQRIDPPRFGYFGTLDNQIAETADHVGYIFTRDDGDWNLADYDAFRASTTITQLQEAQARGIGEAWVSVGWLVFSMRAGCTGACYTPRPDAIPRLLSFKQQLEAAGVASMVRLLYLADEPELRGLTDATLGPLLRSVHAAWPEPLRGVIYGSTRVYPGLADFDAAGRDEYGKGAGVLDDPPPIGPTQMLLLVPGGSDGLRDSGPPDDPRPFCDYALEHSNVYAIVAFVWFDRTDERGVFRRGIRSNGMAPSYRAAAAGLRAGTCAPG